jgi:hypothetical protein
MNRNKAQIVWKDKLIAAMVSTSLGLSYAVATPAFDTLAACFPAASPAPEPDSKAPFNVAVAM